MMEKEQFDPWLQAADRLRHASRCEAYEKNPIWTVDPKHTPYRDCDEEHAAGRLRRQAGLRLGRRDGRLHRRQHGGRGAPAARRRRRKRRSARRSAPSATTRSDDARARCPSATAGSGSTPTARRAALGSDRDDHDALRACSNNRNVLGFVFMLPAAVLLLLFLTYPLGLGIWLGFTDAKIGRAGRVGRPRELRLPVGRHASRGWRCSTRSSTRSSRASSSSRSACGWRCC